MHFKQRVFPTTTLLLLATALSTFGQSTVFTYQGRLNDGTVPANGTYHLRFGLFDALTGGTQVGSPLTNSPINVSNGLFTVGLDFGANFPGANRWLEIGVRTNGGGAFTTLIPRQPITSTPYAITAGNLSGALSSASLSGTYANSVNLNNGANNFSGNGTGLANVNAATLDGLSSANYWQTGGNAGTTPGTHFLGTRDDQPLELKVNNQGGLRLEPTANPDTVNVIGGSARNFVGAGAWGATIGGGGGNQSSNSVEADFGTVSGGALNRIHSLAEYATIGGGYLNTIQSNARSATISGGYQNAIRGTTEFATIGGGAENTIGFNTQFTTIGGGVINRILDGAIYATVPGGRENFATSYAFAAGYRAKAVHTGAFVWADSTVADFPSTVADQFAIRAAGGVRLSDSTPNLSFGSTTRQMLNLFSTNYGIGVQFDSLYFRCANFDANSGFSWYKGGVHHDGFAEPGNGGTELMHLVAGGLYVNGAFVGASDRNLKENFQPVDPRVMLDKVAALPLSQWNYKTDTATRHVGPMAQDFYAAFGVGPDDKHIATVDADGVALAAIQGLNQKLDERLKAKDAEIAELKRAMEALRGLILKSTVQTKK